jgi:hypothetical protein
MDMSWFPSVKHHSSWAGMCPGTRQSAGKARALPPKRSDRWVIVLVGGGECNEGSIWEAVLLVDVWRSLKIVKRNVREYWYLAVELQHSSCTRKNIT